MTPAALLATLHAAGVVLMLDGHALRYRAPTGVMTAALLQELSHHKVALLDLMAAFEERAALLEYAGGLLREEAKRLAWACVHQTPPAPALSVTRGTGCTG